MPKKRRRIKAPEMVLTTAIRDADEGMVEVRVSLEIDWPKLAQEMAKRAWKSKTARATKGAVKAKLLHLTSAS